MRNGNRRSRALALVLCAALLLPLLCFQTPTVQATENDKQDTRPIIVSLGDSYSSGEGIPPFFCEDLDTSEKVKEEDWLAHRSELAWSGMLTLPGVDGDMHDNRNTNWYFVASSGAVTENIARTGNQVKGKDYREGEQEKKYNRDGEKDTAYLPGQLDIFYSGDFDRYDVDYVTITIGGNDLGFADIMELATIQPEDFPVLEAVLNYQLAHYYDLGGFNDQLIACYGRIHNAAPNATIIVAGYPKLLDPAGSPFAFDAKEAALINRAVTIFNDRIAHLISQLKAQNFPIEFVSVERAFEGHGAYSDDPYINPIIPFSQPQDLKWLLPASSYSMHPNEKGARAYAACVQAKINELEGATRDIVMVLDTSGSMNGTPISETREAAKEFVETVIPEDASVGIVTYDDYADQRCVFSMSETYLYGPINELYADGGTNIEDGLRLAAGMLDSGGPDRTRIIVLMSDGEANRGKTGDDLIRYANDLKAQGITIYTLGFFQSVSDKAEAQRVMEAMATSGCHYEVENAEDLVFFFGDMAGQISGDEYVYIRIACPVDVIVRSGDEMLSSAEDDYNTRASFGTLTFEDSEDSEDRTKVLRLREGEDYDIEIVGTGEGTMDYTVGYVDENGEYSDLREIKDVPITSDTVITTGVDRTAKTVLEVDKDGDGEVDERFSATGPNVKEEQEPAEKKPFPLVWIVAGIAALFVLIIVLAIRSGRKRRARKAAKTAAGKKAAPVNIVTPRRFCGKCGTSVPDGSDFCPKCGRQIKK